MTYGRMTIWWCVCEYTNNETTIAKRIWLIKELMLTTAGKVPRKLKVEEERVNRKNYRLKRYSEENI